MSSYPNNLYSWYSTRARNSSGFDLFEALLQYDPIKRLSAKEALHHPYFREREPLPTANAFASLPNGNTIYPARKLIKDESDPKMMPVSNTDALAVEGGGTSNILPGASAIGLPASGALIAGLSGQGSVKASGGGSQALKSSLNNTFLSATGPSAPPPAPASGGSVGPPSNMNSVGPSNPTSINQQQSQSQTQQNPPSNSRGGLVGAATANAGRVAKRQKKA
jgi:serine/threonine protein kinase